EDFSLTPLSPLAADFVSRRNASRESGATAKRFSIKENRLLILARQHHPRCRLANHRSSLHARAFQRLAIFAPRIWRSVGRARRSFPTWIIFSTATRNSAAFR